MRKLIVLVEALALAAVTVTAITVNPRTAEMMVAASKLPPARTRVPLRRSLPSLKRLARWPC